MKGDRLPGWLRRVLRRWLPEPWGEEVLADLTAGVRRRREEGASWIAAVAWVASQVAHPDTFRLGALLRRHRRPHGRRGGRAMGNEGKGFGRVGRLADDLRYALHSLVRNPAYALFACLTLALGTGATTAIFSAVESVMLRPFPYEAAGRIYVMMRPYGPDALLGPTAEQVEAWRAERDVFEAVEPATTVAKTFTGGGQAQGVQVGLVRPRLLELLDLRPRLGRSILPEDVRGEGARVVLLANRVWRSRFGSDPDVVGTTVELDGEPWTVLGVMPARAPFPNGFTTRVDFWAPFAESAADRIHTVLGVAREGVDEDAVQARLDLVRDRAVEAGEPEIEWGGRALPVVDQVSSQVDEPLRILMAAVALLLLIACVGVANLLLSRSTLRRHETAVRTALGATRSRMVRQLLLESLLLGVGGALLGLAAAYAALEAVPLLRPEDMAVLDEIRINPRVLAFTAAVGVLAGLVFGTLPAWQGSRASSLEALRSGARLDRKGGAGRRVRWLLIASEVALSFALLVGSVAAVRVLVEMHRRDPGFRAEGLVAVEVTLPPWKYEEPAQRGAALRLYRERLGGLAGVADLSMGSSVPPDAGLWIGQTLPEGGELSGERRLVFGPRVDADYHRVLGVPLVAGRAFTTEEVREERPVVILGETAARAVFGGTDVVGRRLSYDEGESWVTVVGVAADIRMRGLRDMDDEIQHYRPLPEWWRSPTYAVRLTPGVDPGAFLGRVRTALRAEEPDLLFGHTAPVDDLMRDTAARERFTSALLGAFASLALLLSAVGLYGVVSQTVGQRTREIGIRASLGARRADIRRMVLALGARATLVGVLAGAALAWGGMRVLSSRIVGLEGSGGTASYLASAVFLTLVTLAACWMPARRAARIDPMEALRRE